MRKLLINLTVACLLTASLPALAIDPLSAKALDDICARATEEPDTIETRLCITYINGFLDGAVATDGRVT
jgi:hypothetical protein